MTSTRLRNVVALVALVALGVVAVTCGGAREDQSQESSQRSQTGTAVRQEAASPGRIIRVTGCIQSEADYRRAGNLGRGGAGGTGVGVGNELVLIDASTSPESASTASGTATGTTGPAGQDEDYKLAGVNEGQASPFVGKRVEITGTVEPTEPPGPASVRRPTGTPSIDVFAGEDLNLRELEVASVREMSGACPRQ